MAVEERLALSSHKLTACCSAIELLYNKVVPRERIARSIPSCKGGVITTSPTGEGIPPTEHAGLNCLAKGQLG